MSSGETVGYWARRRYVSFKLADGWLSSRQRITCMPWRFICMRVMSPNGPSVWTGRALQAESDDLERLVLRFCIRPVDGAFELLAIMDIRARSISFATRPRRPDGPPDRERAGETFLHLLF